MEMATTYRGQRVRFRFGHNCLCIEADPDGVPVPIAVRGNRMTIKPGQTIKKEW